MLLEVFVKSRLEEAGIENSLFPDVIDPNSRGEGLPFVYDKPEGIWYAVVDREIAEAIAGVDTGSYKINLDGVSDSNVLIIGIKDQPSKLGIQFIIDEVPQL